jgi:succinate dehydrogenase / fumarate reductase cytochrome b subunit
MAPAAALSPPGAATRVQRSTNGPQRRAAATGTRMADVNRGNRPLSPHLEIYKPEWTMVLSITHRITGVALALGAALVAWWLLAAATSEAYFAEADALLTSWFGDLILLGSTFALWYHFGNGIRHLLWDAGYLLELEPARKSGQAVVVGAVLLTLFTIA